MQREARQPANEVVEELLFECLERAGTDPRGALEAVCAEHPEAAGRLRERFAIAERLGLVELAASHTEVAVPDRLGDFRILERLGVGGMGVVYLAEQESLGRQVALKLVRPEQLYFDGARERFRREVTTVASLSHPGIVPVYAVGEEQGIPYFAMERVRGLSLADALARLAARAPAELTGADLARAVGEAPGGERAPLFDSGWTETCLRIAHAIALALEHAHRSGVLHRDVKPSNVMLTPDGRVMLVDFGLSSAPQGDRITRSGSQVGSLPYMAPELFEGQPADARSDVYALGATLYELLTLRLPYEGRTAPALAAAALEGRPPALRSLQPQASWEAETVCLVALDPDPTRRFASAAEFAHDLANTLAHRPLAARRPGPGLRARRWVERHPALSVGAVLGFLALVVAPTVIVFRQRAANRELSLKGAELRLANTALSRSLSEEAAQRALAERNFERAFEAVELMLSRVGSETLRDLPYMQESRRQLLLDALRFSEELLEERPTDARQRRTLARALLQAGDIQGYLGELEAARSYLARAAQAFAELGAEEGGAPYALEHGRALYKLAQAHHHGGRYEEAEAVCRRAIATLDSASRGRPGDVALHDLRSKLRLQLVEELRADGRATEGAQVLEQLVVELQARVEQEPEALEPMVLLARTLHELGAPSTFAAADAVDPAEGRARVALLEEAAELYERASERMATPGFLHEQGGLWNDLGNARRAAGELQSAHEAFDRAVSVFDALCTGYPGVPSYLEGFGNSLYNRAGLLMAQDRPAEAELGFEAAAAHYQRLRELEPQNPDNAVRCLLCGYERAALAVELRADCAAALARLDRLAPLAEEVARSPRFGLVTSSIGWGTRTTRAQCLVTAGAWPEAAHAAREAVPFAHTPYQLGYVADCLAECAAGTRAEEALEDDERERLAAGYAAEAVTLLRRMLERGASQAQLELALTLDCVRALGEDEAFIDLLVERELEHLLEQR